MHLDNNLKKVLKEVIKGYKISFYKSLYSSWVIVQTKNINNTLFIK